MIENQSLKAGDLVKYISNTAIVVDAPYLENFIGPLIEILVSSRKIKVPVGLITAIKESEE